MKPALDSLKYLHRQIDSIKQIKTPQGIALKLNEVSIQTALITAITTLITVFFGFLIKDYLIPLIVENRTKRRAGQALFLTLKKELFFAANTFDRRVHEIFHTRSHYLWQQSSLAGFYDYKFRSTVFRLCTMLGWLRAYRLQQAQLVIGWSLTSHHNILSRLQEIESALADGQQVEMHVVRAILKIIGIDMTTISNNNLNKFSISIDHQVHETCQKHNLTYISEATDSAKEEFITELAKAAVNDGLNLPDLLPYRNEIVKEVSIKLGLIYRDWQQAIGDLMLIKSDNGYQTISYKIFETYWEQTNDTDEKKWLKRAEVVFLNLNLTVGSSSDARIEQLIRIYKAVYDLQKVLFEINIGRKPIRKEEFNKIDKTIVL